MRSLLPLIYCGFTLALQSCYKEMYVPNAVSTPLFQEAGELRIAAGSNNLQLAYAVSNHFGVMVNGFSNKWSDKQNSSITHYVEGGNTISSEEKHRINGLETGVGYFANNGKGLTWEVYGGVGAFNTTVDRKMSFSSDQNVSHYKIEADANKFFVQPGIGYVNRFFELGLSARFSQLRYKNESYNFINPLPSEILSKDPYYLVEPALTIRGGYNWVKLQGQVVKPKMLSNNSLNFTNTYYTVGVLFDIGGWYKKD